MAVRQNLIELCEKMAHGHYEINENCAEYKTFEKWMTDDQIKIKFIESATLQVASIHPTKRSVTVQAFDDMGVAVPLGSVTVPANYPIPTVGELVEIEYLYVVKSLVQPVFRGVRTDQTQASCTLRQLKYRAGLGEEDAQNDDDALLAA